MKFENKDDVKKWLRSIRTLKKDLELKMDFYKDMLTCCSLNNIFDDDAYIEQYQTDIKYYKDEIDRLNSTLQTLLGDWERLISLLNVNETDIITKRYLHGLSWYEVEIKSYICRRQCFRLQSSALGKLVGQTVSDVNI